MIDIKFAEMEICGNPFCVDVFDPSQVRVGRMPQGILGKCFMFEGKSLCAKPSGLCCHFVTYANIGNIYLRLSCLVCLALVNSKHIRVYFRQHTGPQQKHRK